MDNFQYLHHYFLRLFFLKFLLFHPLGHSTTIVDLLILSFLSIVFKASSSIDFITFGIPANTYTFSILKPGAAEI